MTNDLLINRITAWRERHDDWTTPTEEALFQATLELVAAEGTHAGAASAAPADERA